MQRSGIAEWGARGAQGSRISAIMMRFIRALVFMLFVLFAVAADAHGPRRSSSARKHFERLTGYRHGRPGYVVDHITPLACGGADDPSNMRRQTVAEGKAKDHWERRACSIHKRS